MLNRTSPPAFKELDVFEIVKAKSDFLDNGIPLHLVLLGNQPLVKLEIIFRAGAWYENKNNCSFLTTKILSGGSSKYTAKEIENKVALFGAFIELTPGQDKSTFTLYTLSRHLPSLLPIIYNIIAEPLFPEEELSNLKNITTQNLKINLTKTSYLASSKFKEILFGPNHPYGRPLTEESLSKIKRDDLVGYYQSCFNSNNCDIILSGNGPENFFSIINETFGQSGWGNKSKPKDSKYTSPENSLKTTEIKKEGAVQTSIRIGCKLFTIKHPDYFKTHILIEILGGYFGSRLMKNIREEKGYTYGISSSLVCMQNDGYLVIGTDVKKEFTSETVKEIYKEIEILKSELIGNDELENIKNYILGSFLNSLNTPFSLADKFKTIYFNQLNYDFYNTYVKSIKETSALELLNTANKYLQSEKMKEVIAGG
jgi:zinc protease